MRTLLSVILFFLVVSASAQETGQKAWHFTPGITMTKYFPGAPIKDTDGPWLAFMSIYPQPAREYRFAGTGLGFSVRAFNDEQPNLALTLGAGVTWYYDPDRTTMAVTSPPVLSAASAGIGEQIGSTEFMTFPVSLGLQFVFPYEGRENFMLFGGMEGNVQLVSGNVSMGEQAKLGYALTGGFAVKIFEFGVRYTQFSDMKNLGAYFGFRLSSFSL